MSAVLPVYRDRPQWVPDPKTPGLRVCVAVHDHAYLREKSRWRQRLLEAHADTGGSDFRTRMVLKSRARWEEAERKWYADLHLTPPESPRGPVAVDSDVVKRLLAALHPTAGTRRGRVAEYLVANPTSTPRQIADALGMSVASVRVIRHRLRRQPSLLVNSPQWSRMVRLVRLLADGLWHSIFECQAVTGMNVCSLSTYIGRMRSRGLDVETVRRTGGSGYRLVQ